MRANVTNLSHFTTSPSPFSSSSPLHLHLTLFHPSLTDDPPRYVVHVREAECYPLYRAFLKVTSVTEGSDVLPWPVQSWRHVTILSIVLHLLPNTSGLHCKEGPWSRQQTGTGPPAHTTAASKLGDAVMSLLVVKACVGALLVFWDTCLPS